MCIYNYFLTFFLLLNGFLLYRYLQFKKEFDNLKFFYNRINVALEASGSGIWDWNIITNEVYFSPVWKKLIGYEDHEIKNQFEEWSSRVHSDDLPLVMEQVQENLDNKKQEFHNRYRMKHKDGHWVWIDDRGKTFYDENGKAIRMSGLHSDATYQKQIEEHLNYQQEKLYYQANYDSLTALPNRKLLEDRLKQCIKIAKRNSTKVAVIFFDLDHFKEINDSFGHKVGDIVLQTVSQRVLRLLRASDTLSRLGGDEFIVVVPDVKDDENVAILAQKILNVIEKPIKHEEHMLYLSCSIGISLFPSNGKDSNELLKFADTAMYNAKNNGRNCFSFYKSFLTEKAFEKVFMISSMKKGLENEEFFVYYQPQYDAKLNKLVGMEALIRWKHPELGLVPPDKFIPLAESNGFIIELDRYVMQTAMKQFASWYKQGYNPGKLSINLAPKQLKKDDFIAFLNELLTQYECSHECIVLEITETQLVESPDKAEAVLNKIAALGVKIAIDDFGTGYSSLVYLKKFPISKVKIDQSFIRDLFDNEDNRLIVQTIIALANNLNLKLIAEGVETKEQLDFLQEHGCNIIQGYYYSKPVNSVEMATLLKEELQKVVEM